MNFPVFRIEDKELPIMLCGSAPFIGEGLFGFKATDYRIKFYSHPDSMADIFVHFVRQGCRGAHILCYDNILKAVKMAYDVEKFPIAASLVTKKDIPSQLKALSAFQTILVFVSPADTDSLDEKTLKTITGEISNAGMIPGLATHQPGITIPQLEQMSIDFSAYLAPVNKKGKHMIPSKEKTLDAMKNASRKVVAMKPLAVGNMLPEEGFPFVLEHTDAFCVGFTSKEQVDDAFKVLTKLIGKM